jgi:hypothetical protein
MSAGRGSEITLRALEGRPLEDDRVRDRVIATAHAIAERQGLKLVAVQAQPDRITVTLNSGRIETLGFAAELRRLTARWYAQKHGGDSLWGRPPEEEGEQWKRA